MADSIHTARWLMQFDSDNDKEIALFPSTFAAVKDDLKDWKRLYGPISRLQRWKRAAIAHLPISKANTALHYVLDRTYGKDWRVKWLIKTIKRLKPDIIHSLEFQSAGYTCLKAKRQMGKDFPTWIATNWGSDIYLFSQLKNHIEPIKGILNDADFYSAECQRDYDLAQNLGLKATPLPVIPNAGGMHLEIIENLRKRISPSQRKILLIKGYQMIFGRALTALKAIELVADDLKKLNIEIYVYAATADVEIPAELTANKTGLDIKIITIKNYMSHQDVLELQSKARCYVGMSISDGISTSMLEAMALGAFPIQTCTSCANEWIEDGISGYIAPCEDEKELGKMILSAMTDDNLVESASAKNWQTLQEKASYEHVREIARNFYVQASASKGAAPTQS